MYQRAPFFGKNAKEISDEQFGKTASLMDPDTA
jgi:hypothetical protein